MCKLIRLFLSGVAEEFEMVDGVPHIIALEDSEEAYGDFERWSDDSEWEELYEGEKQVKEVKSYSAVLGGG